jgi:Ran GTPase-activating protein (RanGAP) involved in mRNA processing and transport
MAFADLRFLPPPPLLPVSTLSRFFRPFRFAQVADFADIFTGRLISEIPQSLRALCTSLLTLPELHTVDFSDNAFGGRTADPM